MGKIWCAQRFAGATLCASLSVAAAVVGAPLVDAQTAPSSPPKTTEQAFKNIQVLKGLASDQLIPSMQFIAASLGVECDFCHVEGAFERDDKKPKLAARKMIQMVFAIDKDHFDRHRQVTCNTCHRGSVHPVAIPALAGAEPATRALARSVDAEPSGDPAPEANRPSADPILEKYLAAVGGREALTRISSRVAKGYASVGGHQVPIEIFARAPDKRVSILHLPNGDNVTAYDGHSGWLGSPGRPPRPMEPSEVEAAQLDAELYFPARLKEIFAQFRVGPDDKIDGQEVSLVRGLRDPRPPVELYFDKQSGLLLRMVRYADSPLGLNPTEIDYADYRDAGGVKIPFRWTIARPGGRFTIQVDQVEQNVPIDAAKFEAPPSPAAADKPPSR